MASITFDRFDGGLDVRRGASVSDGNRLRVLKECYVTPGRNIKKRPCLRRIATLEPGTVGLKAAGGKLNTFYESGTIAHSNLLFRANKVPHPTLSQNVSKAHFADMFLGYVYAVIEYADGSVWHHYLDGTPATHISDANCPQTKGVIKASNKIWAVDGENVRFCAAGDARDWTTASDAGFIPAGRTQSGSGEALALGTFQRQLVVFFIDGAQLWDVDEDPALNKIKQQIYGVGTQYAQSPASFSNDVFFLSDVGFRSITVSSTNVDNFIDVDIGSPIDDLVTPSLPTASEPRGLYVPGFGQYWCFMWRKAWVYTYSRSAKLAVWSEYNVPVNVDDYAALNNKLYIRSGDAVYEFTKDVFTDDGEVVNVEIDMSFVDCKSPGNLKQFFGADFVGDGTPSLAFKFDPNETDFETEQTDFMGDSRTGELTPVDVSAVNIAPIIRHAKDEDFRMDALALYFNTLGAI